MLEEEAYPSETLEKLGTASIVITSDLKKAIESARFLNPDLPAVSDSSFREVELPIPFAKFRELKLHPSIWAVTLRCLWFVGYSRGCESLQDANTRAAKATEFLVECANEHHHVVLVGHGFFNRLIGKELKKRDWGGRKEISTMHWTSTTYSF